jgi:hypothetical protein
MIENNKIIDKISARIESLQNEDKSQYPDDYKQHLSIEESVYRRIKSELEFQILSPVEKQSKRIEYLAMCRKTDANCDKKLQTILIYDSIIIALPYIKVLSHLGKLILIEKLCLKEIDIIDNSLTGDVKVHISKLEIETAFKPYFEKIAPFKMDMLKESYEKIENLYNELLKLNETA